MGLDLARLRTRVTHASLRTREIELARNDYPRRDSIKLHHDKAHIRTMQRQ